MRLAIIVMGGAIAAAPFGVKHSPEF